MLHSLRQRRAAFWLSTTLGLAALVIFAWSSASLRIDRRLPSGHLDFGNEGLSWPARVTKDRLTPETLPQSWSGCDDLPGGSGMVLGILTTVNGALNRLPILLATSLRCVKEPIIISDLASRLGRYVVQDAFASLPADLLRESDFNFYWRLQTLVDSGRVKELPTAVVVQDNPATSNLFALKVLQAVRLAWQLQPGRDWYVLVSDNSYVNLPNLLHLLGKYNARGAWLQSNLALKPDPHAHPGVTFVFSGEVVRQWIINGTLAGGNWGARSHSVLASRSGPLETIQRELNTNMLQLGQLGGEEQHLLAFDESNWCRPVITVAAPDATAVDSLYHVEQSRNGSQMLYRDIYHALHPHHLPFRLENWDNGAADDMYALEVVPNDPERAVGQWEPKDLIDPSRSYMGCELACIQNAACMQFLHVTRSGGPSTCLLSSAIRSGTQRFAEEKDGTTLTFTSGFKSDRIAKWAQLHDNCTPA